MPGTLYLVATPIGNLQDITLRALETLKTVDLIACEDTRHTRKLLNHFKIAAKLVSYHEHNEIERADELSRQLAEGKTVAIVSDAGTPGICDPGYRIVQKAIEIGAEIVPVPGAAAFVNAAIASGLPTDSLFFGGFLPSRKGERQKRLMTLRDVPATLVFYETPHRLDKALADCLFTLGDRPAAVVRELTKMHEEVVRGSIAELQKRFSSGNVKGEIVLVFGRSDGAATISGSERSLSQRVAEIEFAGVDHKQALKQAAREFGLSKSEAYRRLLAEKT